LIALKIVPKMLILLIIISSLASLGYQVEPAQASTTTLSYPSTGQISYGSTVSSYMPWMRKEAVIPTFISLANQYGGKYESIGKSSSPYNWDIILFKFGNPSGTPIMIDSYLHGNEFYGSEVLYSLIKWLLTSGDSYAKQILSDNYILVVPIVNYRWGRTNNNVPSWMTAKDPSNDGGKCGVNLNRNFDPNWPSSLSRSNTDSYSGTAASSSKEAQALINAWSKYHPRIYWNLHQGASPYTWAAASTTQAKTDANRVKSLLSGIQSALGVTGKWTFSVSSGGGSGNAYNAAQNRGIAGFMTEVMSGWEASSTKKASLDSGATFKQVKAMFIAMCEAI
jgi:predicted deacylase